MKDEHLIYEIMLLFALFFFLPSCSPSMKQDLFLNPVTVAKNTVPVGLEASLPLPSQDLVIEKDFQTKLTGTTSMVENVPGNWQFNPNPSYLFVGDLKLNHTYNFNLKHACASSPYLAFYKYKPASGWVFDRWVNASFSYTVGPDFDHSHQYFGFGVSQSKCAFSAEIKEVAPPAPVVSNTNTLPLRSPVGSGNGFIGAGYYDASPFMNYVSGLGNHLGFDLNGVNGGNSDLADPLFAVANGTVLSAYNAGKGWGNILALQVDLSGKKYTAFYAHLNEFKVKAGDSVKKGQLVGSIGRGNDNEYTAHLHFEWRVGSNSTPGPGYTNSKVTQGPQGQISVNGFF